MKRWILATSVVVVLAAIVAGGLAFSMVREAQATSYEILARLVVLNDIHSDDYAEWVTNYTTYKSDSTNVWMDWSEDGCSVPEPIASLPVYREEFDYGCKRHDFMWQTLAVLDAGTGRVWHERNRYIADDRLSKDMVEICESARSSGIMGTIQHGRCTTTAGGWHFSIREWSGLRSALTPAEMLTVTLGQPGYNDGYTMLNADADCNAEANRCLPITYMEWKGVPFVPKDLGFWPMNATMKTTLIRANHTSIKGPPWTYLLFPPWQTIHGETRGNSNYPA